MSEAELRVLFLIGSASRGGAETQVVRLAAELRSAGHLSAVLFLNQGGPLTDDLDRAQVPWRVVGYPGLAPSRIRFVPTRDSICGLSNLAKLVPMAFRNRPDIAHVFLPEAVAIGLPLLHPRGAGVAGVRGFTPMRSSRVRSAVVSLYGRQLRHADAVVCNAPHLAEDTRSQFGLDPSRQYVIPNGVDLPATVADVGQQPPRAVVVANFQPYKGYNTLLQALGQTDCTLSVALCGTGAEREPTQSQAATQGLSSRLDFIQPPANVPEQLSQAQFAIHPSHTEGLSNAILEELAHGLPVIACDVGGNPTLIRHGHNGLLVPPADPAALADAINTLATNPELRREMAISARATAAQYSWERCTQAHIDLYTTLLENK